MRITEDQKKFLKGKHISLAKFEVGDVVFDCWEGEWMVTKAGEHVDVFTFRMYEENEINEVLTELGIN